MKLTKYIIITFLFAFAFLATGERFVYHLAHFEDTYYGITFEYDLYGKENSRNLVRDKIEQKLVESDLDVFRVDTKYISDRDEIKIIYGTPGALENLIAKGIDTKTYESSIIGNVTIELKDFSEIEDIYESDMFYIVGSLDKAARFKSVSLEEASAYYGVKDIKSVLSGSEKGVYATLALVWGIAFFMSLLLSLYEVILQKKEIVVRLTLGENIIKVFVFNALTDIAVFAAIFIVLSQALLVFSNVTYKIDFVTVMFVAMLMLNTLVNLYITKINLKNDFAKVSGNKGIIVSTYIVKTISIITATLLLCVYGAVITEGLDYFKQKDVFDNIKNYNYYKIYYTMSTRNNGIPKPSDEQLWVDFDYAFGDSSIRMCDLSESFQHNTILINQNAVELQKSFLGNELYNEIINAEKSGVNIFFPAKHSDDNTISKTTLMASAIFFHNAEDDFHTYSYSGKSRVLSIDDNTFLLRSKFTDNPVIIIDYTEHLTADSYLNPLYFGTNILYDVSDVDFNTFIAENNMQHEILKITNSYELYEFNSMMMMRNIKLLGFITFLVLLLEISIIIFTVKLHYSNNGIEITIKKTLGYSLFERNRALMLLPLLTVIICTVASGVIVFIVKMGSIISVLLIGIILLVIELFVLILQSRRLEKMKISAVLKGVNV
jgi:hypothetical protein